MHECISSHLTSQASSDEKNIILYKNNPANEVFLYRFSLFLAQSYALRHASVGVEHLIALLTLQCFQIPLTPRMFPVWDFMVGIFARKALLNQDLKSSCLSELTPIIFDIELTLLVSEIFIFFVF